MVVFIHATLPTIHISTSGLTFYHLLSVHVVLTKKNLWTWSQIEFPGNGSISELHSLQLGGIWHRRCRADYLAGTPLIGTECQAELFESMPIAQPDDVQNVFGALQNYFHCLLVFASPLKLMMQCPSPIWCSLISTKFGKNWSPVCGGAGDAAVKYLLHSGERSCLAGTDGQQWPWDGANSRLPQPGWREKEWSHWPLVITFFPLMIGSFFIPEKNWAIGKAIIFSWRTFQWGRERGWLKGWCLNWPKNI